MRASRPPGRAFGGLSLIALSACLLVGCGRSPAGGERYPVAGAVTLDGRPLAVPGTASGRVWFHPDATKGHSGSVSLVGMIDEGGRYEMPEGGVSPGWYRVTVVVADKVDPQKTKQLRKSFVAGRYGRPETSGLSVQVVADPAPGAYDLRLKR